MPLIVVRHTLEVAQPLGQHRLAALQRLTLALLVNAWNQRVLRRIQVQPHDVSQLLDEKRIRRELERFLPMRLQPKGRLHPPHSRLRNAGHLRHVATAPMRRPLGLAVKRVADPLRCPLIVNAARPPRAVLVVEPFDPLAGEQDPAPSGQDRSPPSRPGSRLAE